MPTERLSMRRIRELLRLRFENGLSSRVIAASLGISKGAVGEYLQRALVAGLNWPLPDGMTDTALELLLFPGQPKASVVPRPEPGWAQVDQELRRTGVTRSLLWQEYRAEHPEGYGYAWFCEHYDTWKRRVSPPMRQSHVAGEKVFVDFAGDTIDVIDPLTGGARAMKLFVAALGASSYVYCEARPSEGLADWIGCHVGMFSFFGGVAAIIVCDNLKAAVTNPDRYEPGINRTYQDMAAITEPRSYRPGPTSRATRPRSSSRCCWSNAGVGPPAQSALLQSGGVKPGDHRTCRRTQRPRHARLQRQPRRPVRHCGRAGA